MAMNLKELGNSIDEFCITVEKSFNGLNIQAQESELEQLKVKLEDPQFYQGNEKYDEMRSIQMRMGAIEKKVTNWLKLRNNLTDLKEYQEIAQLEGEESMLIELEQKLEKLRSTYAVLDLESLLDGPDDFRNAFVNIHPGAGGTESHDWADMLYRAYLRWAEKQGYKVNIVDYQDGEEAGLKNVTMLIEGINAYGFLKAENGIHRLVRISPFDSNAKRHTSFVSLHVSPEISDDVAVEIDDKDLRVDTYRASGAGGQHINKTDSAIRITHEPTGIVVQCQNERSQMKNRSTAMKMLKAKLYELEQQKLKEKMDEKSGEQKDIAWGSQIRSYVFHPYNMVKDLRTKHETSNVQAVMDGDFSPFIDAYLRMKKSAQVHS